MVKDWVRFDSIEVDREGYFVKYTPVFTGDNLSVLVVTLYEDFNVNEVIKIMEDEFRLWVEKYPTPIMVMMSNNSKSSIDLMGSTGNDYIVGYPSNMVAPIIKWAEVNDDEYSNFSFSKTDLFIIYEGLNYKTSDDVHKKYSADRRGRRKLIVIMVIWFSVIPSLIAYYGWANPYVSLIALVYSLYIAVKKGAEITGFKKLSVKDEKKASEEFEKSHHHHHCKKNPDAFLRLKVENFRNDSEEKLADKIVELKKLKENRAL